MHLVVEFPICRCGSPESAGALIKEVTGLLQAAEPQHTLLSLLQAATVSFREKPPGKTGGANKGPRHSTDEQGATGACRVAICHGLKPDINRYPPTLVGGSEAEQPFLQHPKTWQHPALLIEIGINGGGIEGEVPVALANSLERRA